MKDLESRGFKVIKLKNTWDVENATYRGINAVLESPGGQRFELQFHTEESFIMKDKTLHPYYEERRVLADDNPRAAELDAIMTAYSATLQRPTNIEEVYDR